MVNFSVDWYMSICELHHISIAVGINRYKWKNKRPIAILTERENPNTLNKKYILRFAKVSQLQFFPKPYQSMFNQLFNCFPLMASIGKLHQ